MIMMVLYASIRTLSITENQLCWNAVLTAANVPQVTHVCYIRLQLLHVFTVMLQLLHLCYNYITKVTGIYIDVTGVLHMSYMTYTAYIQLTLVTIITYT
jgi:hypothetical protein